MIGLGLLVALLGLLGIRLQAVRAAGPVLYVAPGGSDTTDCANSASPCATMQYAVDQADPGAEIRVAAGIYTGVSAREGITQVVYISKTVTIRGGYTTTFAEPADPIANPTTLDAQGQGRVLYISGNISPTIEGLRITGGNAAGLGGGLFNDDGGGGVYVINATAIISSNYVFGNRAFLGGGLYLYSSNAMLVSDTVTANDVGYLTVDSRGGGIMLQSSTATLVGNVIISNSAYFGGGLDSWDSDSTLNGNEIGSNTANYGGGLHLAQGSAVTLMGNTIISNVGASSGGGVYGEGGDATIIGNSITANKTNFNSGGSGGAGLYLHSSNAVIGDNFVASNTTASIGGGLYLLGGNVTLDDNMIVSNTAIVGGGLAGAGALSGNTFVANSAQYYGGGLALGALTTLDGDVVISNTATLGGGLAIQDGDVTLTNTIVADNQATAMDGAGLLIYGSMLRLLHTTIARNGGDDGSGVFVGDGSTAALTNTILVSHAVGITIDVGGMAMLEATLWGSGTWANVTDVGGAGTIITGTVNVRGDPVFVNPGARNYHIGPGSAAIDAGVSAGVSTDIDGDARPSGAGHDIGADEFTLAFTHSLYLPVVLRQFP